MIRSPRVFFLWLVSVLTIIPSVPPAYAAGCDRYFSSKLPEWVESRSALDKDWWISVVEDGQLESIRKIQFVDRSTAELGNYVGQGWDGVVYRLDRSNSVIKLPGRSLPWLWEEISREVSRSEQFTSAGFDIAAVTHSSQPGDLPWVVKPFVRGPPLRTVQRSRMSENQIEGLAKIYVTGLRTGVHPDLCGLKRDNLIWEESRQRWVLVDLGGECKPDYFKALDRVFAGRSTLDLYRQQFFAGDEAATVVFKSHADQLLRSR